MLTVTPQCLQQATRLYSPNPPGIIWSRHWHTGGPTSQSSWSLQRGDELQDLCAEVSQHRPVSRKNTAQVIIVLDRPIWPEGFFDVVCPGSFLPELWVTTYPPARGYAGPPLYGIIGFACGLKADQIGGMREAAVVQASLSQLDEMFGGF